MKLHRLGVMMMALASTALSAQTPPPGAPPGGMPASMPSGPPPGMGPVEPSHPARQTHFTIHLDGVNAVQLAWWFQHIADDKGRYWKPLAPATNRSIEWRINPREDAHQLIGAMFTADQHVPGGLFAGDTLHLQAQFQDYITPNRSFVPGQPVPINPPLAMPRDYAAPFPSPMVNPFGGPLGPLGAAQNGFNEQMLLTDGDGFAPGRILWSWRNSGDDDTAASAGKPRGVDIVVTIYQHWMEDANRPGYMAADGYAWTPEQVDAVWGAWRDTLKAIPAQLPGWFDAETQDGLARRKGYTVSGLIDTGIVPGVTSKMMVWWWNHAMGDAPGISYSFWCPPAHYAIRWLPGYSPSAVLKGAPVPDDHVVPGAIYPDLQGGSLAQNGGGMMSYPPAMAPVPGRYKVLDPMFPVSRAQVADFAKTRFPQPPSWLLHQWEDRPEGLIHRSTMLMRLPLRAPLTQQGFYAEHQLMEGQFWGNSPGMRKAYAAWLAGNRKR